MRRAADPAPARALPEDRAEAFKLTPVSRETAERLDSYVALLLNWQRTTNLIAASTMPQVWTRHIADCLQLVELASEAPLWVDLGSGAGLPGVVIACALAPVPRAMVHVVEANGKKAAFLREAARATGAPVTVHWERIENFVTQFRDRPNVVCARALAPLDALLELAFPLLGKTGTIGLFPKGQSAGVELAQASNRWAMRATTVASRTDPKARIVVVGDVERRPGAP